MPRFYISDGARPGRRTPVNEYATRVLGVGSDILNEGQAIQRGRKLVATLGAAVGYTDWRVWVGRPNPSEFVLIAEIELLAGGTNVAPLATMTADPAAGNGSWGSTYLSLTDGVQEPSGPSAANYWQVYSQVDGWTYIHFHFAEPRVIDTVKVWRDARHDPAIYAPTKMRVQRGDSPTALSTVYETLNIVPPWTAHTATVSATPLPSALIPVAFGTSGNYNGTYDINGVDPMSGTTQVHFLSDGSAAGYANHWQTARVGGAAHWAAFDLGGARSLTSYRVRHLAVNAAAGWVPVRWRLEGSNTAGWGGPWTTLDDKTGSDHTWASPYEYDATIAGSFRYVRLYIPAQPGYPNDSYSVGELTIFGTDGV